MSRSAAAPIVPAEVPSYEYAVDAYAQVSREIKALEVAKARLGAVILAAAPDPAESFKARGFISDLSCVYSEPRRLVEGALQFLLDEKSPQWLAKNYKPAPQWAPRTVASGFDPSNLPANFPNIEEGEGDRVKAYTNYLPLLIAAAKLTP